MCLSYDSLEHHRDDFTLGVAKAVDHGASLSVLVLPHSLSRHQFVHQMTTNQISFRENVACIVAKVVHENVHVSLFSQVSAQLDG